MSPQDQSKVQNPKSDEIPQAPEADWLAAGEWFRVQGADRPAPERGLVAEAVDERWSLALPAGQELAVVALQGLALLLPESADVQHERRLRDLLQMKAVIMKHPLGMEWPSVEVALCELRPEPGRLDQLDRG